ncbi:MAG TPA: hypothetical protein VMF56_16290 [Acidobacteriaceae bacterium]|nr:hypothetical protein [Acidobacteriaceae bacterium]
MKWMCSFFICLVVTPFAIAQNAPTVKQAESACGSFDVKFDVKTNAKQHPLAQAEAGKAQIYVIEDWDWADTGRINRPTVRVAMDGKWVGADQGDSYIFFPADAGRRHLCVSWQAGMGSSNNLIAVYGFDAKPNQTYYFRASIPRGQGISFSLNLEPLNIDEAQLLLARYPQASSTIKR